MNGEEIRSMAARLHFGLTEEEITSFSFEAALPPGESGFPLRREPPVVLREDVPCRTLPVCLPFPGKLIEAPKAFREAGE